MKELFEMHKELQQALDKKVEFLTSNERYTSDSHVHDECQNRQQEIDGFKISIERTLADPLVFNLTFHKNDLIKNFNKDKEEILNRIEKIK